MENTVTYLFDISGVLIVAGIIFWLAGGAKWVEQIIREKELDIAKRKKDLKETRE